MSEGKTSESAAMPARRAADPDSIRVGKYKGTRYWAVWLDDQLLAVTVYKKGAVAIKNTLCSVECLT